MHLFCGEKKKILFRAFVLFKAVRCLGTTGGVFSACWLRPKIYRSVGRVRMNHCKPLLAGLSLPREATSDLPEAPGDPGWLGQDALAGKLKGSTGIYIEDVTS